MDILKLLHRDHQEIRLLIGALEDTSEHALKTRLQIFEMLCTALSMHIQAEEWALYAPMKLRHPEMNGQVLKFSEVHHVACRLLAELTDLPKDDERWLPTLLVLKEALERHMKEEEGEFFEEVHGSFGWPALREMGERFTQKKESLRLGSNSLKSEIQPAQGPAPS